MGNSKRSIFMLAFALLAITVLLAGCGQGNKGEVNIASTNVNLSGFKNADIFITPQQLNAGLGKQDLVILDFNKPDVYAKGHIPGAINVSWSNFSYMEGKPGDKMWGGIQNKEDLTKTLSSYGVDNTKTVVAYSDVLKGPGPDGRFIWQARMGGLENAKLLYGGMANWEKSGYKLVTEPGKAVAATGLQLKDFDQGYDATTEFVAQNLGQIKIIDCRTKKEFDGAQNNGEARGGHIQGAIFLEWKTLLNEDATPKPANEIIAIMKDNGISPEDDLVLY